ncbi:MAG: cytochrome c [Gammaproteobacteria bacterium]|nr:cytochrome c [Gammaproteobacteria bacterium]
MSHTVTQSWIRIVWVAGALVWGAVATAAEPEDIIKYRQSVMKSVGGHMGALTQIVRGKVEYPDDVQYHVESIARSMKTVLSLFPVDSDFGETRALESVWSKPDDFKKVAEAAAIAAGDLVQAYSKSSADIGEKFEALGEACKACHKDFREEDK